MENASKALIIAASVLIAMLIIGAAVYMFNVMSSIQAEEEASSQTQIITEFNQKFDVYNRKILYGSDILSLANMIDDYNVRETVESKMYQEMQIHVTIKKQLTSSTDKKYSISAGTYTAQQLRDKLIAEGKNSVTDKINEIEATYSQRGRMSIQNLNNLQLKSNSYITGTGTYQDAFQEEIAKDIYRNLDVEEDIQTYVDLSAILKDFRTKIFSCTQVRYDEQNQNGRIVEMNFEEAV